MGIRTHNKGFTLIELLVVIAIIGLLASVVLASLNSARDKGAAASIKANLNNSRVQAELYYDNNANSYGVSAYSAGGVGSGTGVCNTGTTANPTMYEMLVASNVSNGGDATATVLCNSTAAAWAAEARLVPLTPTLYYCVDSTGVGRVNTTSKGAGTVCPNTPPAP